MKSKLRILAITLIMVLSFGLVSVNADATSYGITVNGVALTSEKTSVDAGSGTVSYDATAKELTFNNATISSTMDDATQGVISIRNGEAVTIKLVGTNTITNTGNLGQGITAKGEVTITGSGSLTINTKGNGVYVATPDANALPTDSLTVKDTTLNVTSTAKDALYASTKIVIDYSVVDLKAPKFACGAISASVTSVTFNNIEIADKKVLQASNDPITVNTAIINPPSTFDKSNNYHYVKVSNMYTVTAEWDVNSTVALETAGPSSGDAGKILVMDGDTVTATIGTADGYKIKSVLVNGKESKDSVKDGKLTFTVNGDTSIKVVSEAKEKSPNTGDEAGLYTIIAMLALLGATATVKLSGKNN